MRLLRFRVQNYKVIDDTGQVEVDENVTALVGRNESGKTAILRALWKSRNVADEEFDKLLDYPRARYSLDRKGNQWVTVLDFKLTNDETAELGKLFPFRLDPLPKTATLHTWYVGEEKTGSGIVFEEHVEARIKQSSTEARKTVTAVEKALAAHAGAGDTAIADASKAALAQLDAKHPSWHKTNAEALVGFRTAIDAWTAGAAERAPHARAERQRLEELVVEAQKGDPAAGAREWVEKRVPSFIYFDDYGQLETRIHLPTYIQQAKEQPIPARIRTQRALFRWSRLDPDEILTLGAPDQPNETREDVQRRLDKRRTLLESASFHLTGEWVDWWIPGTKHQLHISADRDYLVLNVSDTTNPFQIPFEERSHGFQWFFSFYLVFLVESEDAHAESVLLLDEPGLHLHPLMQQRLVGFFDRVSKTNQILYSTHLPFLVDPEHLDRVRTVYLNKETPPKTIVSDDLRAGGDRDTLFPLQAALGYSIAQTLFMGKRTLIVEGSSDSILIKALDSCFVALGRDGHLNPETVIAPAGGIKHLMPLASIMLASTSVGARRLLVLLDSDDAGRGAKTRVARDIFGDDSGVLMLGEAIGIPDATIEDLVPRADYTAAATGALKRTIKLNAAEVAEPTNVAALARHWQRKGWGPFGPDEKVATALWLSNGWTADPTRIPKETLRHVESLFTAINARFP